MKGRNYEKYIYIERERERMFVLPIGFVDEKKVFNTQSIMIKKKSNSFIQKLKILKLDENLLFFYKIFKFFT